jgi:superfamily II DNA/RNA helicase
MTAEGHKVASLHGAKDASQRDVIIDNFREGREKVLITTNVIARGIDILQVRFCAWMKVVGELLTRGRSTWSSTTTYH